VAGGAALPAARTPAGATPPAAPSAPNTGGSVANPATTPAAYSFGGVPLSLVVGGFLVAIAGARRVRRYVERLIALTSA
jgi:hypothetical protein